MEKNDLLQPSSVAEMAEKIKPCPDVSTASVSDNTSEGLDRSDTSTTVSGDEFPPSKSPLSPSSSTEDMRQEPQDYQPKHSGLTATALCLGWFMEIGACVLSLGSLVSKYTDQEFIKVDCRANSRADNALSNHCRTARLRWQGASYSAVVNYTEHILGFLHYPHKSDFHGLRARSHQPVEMESAEAVGPSVQRLPARRFGESNRMG